MAFFKFFLLIFYLVFFITFPNAAKETTYDACNLFFKLILPSFIPMYLISNILLNYGSFFKVIKRLIPFMHFENEEACGIFILGFLCGNPTTAALIKKSTMEKSISVMEGSNLLLFSGMLSPLFIIMSGKMIGLKMFEIISVIISCIASTFILGSIILHKNKSINNKLTTKKNNDFWLILDEAPKILLNILLVIIVTMLLKSPFTLLKNMPIFFKFFIDLLEVTTGINSLISYNVNPFLKLLIFTFFISLSGIAILIESIVVIKKKEQTIDEKNSIVCSKILSINKFIVFRLFLALLATFICGIINYIKFFF